MNGVVSEESSLSTQDDDPPHPLNGGSPATLAPQGTPVAADGDPAVASFLAGTDDTPVGAAPVQLGTTTRSVPINEEGDTRADLKAEIKIIAGCDRGAAVVCDGRVLQEADAVGGAPGGTINVTLQEGYAAAHQPGNSGGAAAGAGGTSSGAGGGAHLVSRVLAASKHGDGSVATFSLAGAAISTASATAEKREASRHLLVKVHPDKDGELSEPPVTGNLRKKKLKLGNGGGRACPHQEDSGTSKPHRHKNAAVHKKKNQRQYNAKWSRRGRAHGKQMHAREPAHAKVACVLAEMPKAGMVKLMMGLAMLTLLGHNLGTLNHVLGGLAWLLTAWSSSLAWVTRSMVTLVPYSITLVFAVLLIVVFVSLCKSNDIEAESGKPTRNTELWHMMAMVALTVGFTVSCCKPVGFCLLDVVCTLTKSPNASPGYLAAWFSPLSQSVFFEEDCLELTAFNNFEYSATVAVATIAVATIAVATNIQRGTPCPGPKPKGNGATGSGNALPQAELSAVAETDMRVKIIRAWWLKDSAIVSKVANLLRGEIRGEELTIGLIIVAVMCLFLAPEVIIDLVTGSSDFSEGIGYGFIICRLLLYFWILAIYICMLVVYIFALPLILLTIIRSAQSVLASIFARSVQICCTGLPRVYLYILAFYSCVGLGCVVAVLLLMLAIVHSTESALTRFVRFAMKSLVKLAHGLCMWTHGQKAGENLVPVQMSGAAALSLRGGGDSTGDRTTRSGRQQRCLGCCPSWCCSLVTFVWLVVVFLGLLGLLVPWAAEQLRENPPQTVLTAVQFGLMTWVCLLAGMVVLALLVVCTSHPTEYAASTHESQQPHTECECEEPSFTTDDPAPEEGHDYPFADHREPHRKATVAKFIAVYNETAQKLENTMLSMLKEDKLRDCYVQEVLIVVDGVQQVAMCTRRFLSARFGVNWANLGDAANPRQTNVWSEAYKKNYNYTGGKSADSGLDKLLATRRDIKFTLMVKKKNKQKHNGHKWAMKAFIKAFNAKYLFLTDVATTFDKKCIKKLVEYMDSNPSVSAVCGRQRAMSPQDQGDNSKTKLEEWIATMLRHYQVAEFEADGSVSKRVWDFLGFHPVIPGPCGLYRCEQLADKRADEYFKIVENVSQNVTLFLANLKIAEDRIPSLLAVFYPDATDNKFTTHWIGDAVFYFEAELTLKALVLQRRRWLNGTAGGYIHLLTNPGKLICSSKQPVWRKLAVWLMVFKQVAQIVVVVLFGPAFVTFLVHEICAYPVKIYHSGHAGPRCTEPMLQFPDDCVDQSHPSVTEWMLGIGQCVWQDATYTNVTQNALQHVAMQYDTNRDGTLSKAEFDQCQPNQQGICIQLWYQIYELAAQRGYNVEQFNFPEAAFQLFDFDRNNNITQDEFNATVWTTATNVTSSNTTSMNATWSWSEMAPRMQQWYDGRGTCATASVGDDCDNAIEHARTSGVFKNPERYPGLNKHSTKGEFQCLLAHSPYVPQCTSLPCETLCAGVLLTDAGSWSSVLSTDDWYMNSSDMMQNVERYQDGGFCTVDEASIRPLPILVAAIYFVTFYAFLLCNRVRFMSALDARSLELTQMTSTELKDLAERLEIDRPPRESEKDWRKRIHDADISTPKERERKLRTMIMEAEFKDPNSRQEKKKAPGSDFCAWVWWLGVIIDIIVTVFTFVTCLVHVLVRGLGGPEVAVVVALLSHVALPLLLSILDGCMWDFEFKSPSLLLWHLPAMSLLQISMNVRLTAYSAVRVSDLSWGNRDVGNVISAKQEKHQAILSRTGKAIAVVAFLFNAGAAIGLIIWKQVDANADDNVLKWAIFIFSCPDYVLAGCCFGYIFYRWAMSQLQLVISQDATYGPTADDLERGYERHSRGTDCNLTSSELTSLCPAHPFDPNDAPTCLAASLLATMDAQTTAAVRAAVGAEPGDNPYIQALVEGNPELPSEDRANQEGFTVSAAYCLLTTLQEQGQPNVNPSNLAGPDLLANIGRLWRANVNVVLHRPGHFVGAVVVQDGWKIVDNLRSDPEIVLPDQMQTYLRRKKVDGALIPNCPADLTAQTQPHIRNGGPPQPPISVTTASLATRQSGSRLRRKLPPRKLAQGNLSAQKGQPSHTTGKEVMQLPKGCVCTPSLQELQAMSEDDRKRVPNFMISKSGCIKLQWVDAVDVTVTPDLRDLLTWTLTTSGEECKSVDLFPDGLLDSKPPLGTGLNKPCRITLWMWKGKTVATMQNKWIKLWRSNNVNADFSSYNPSTGVCEIKVQHFSAYGLDSDEESVDGVVGPEPEPEYMEAVKPQMQCAAYGLSSSGESSDDDIGGGGGGGGCGEPDYETDCRLTKSQPEHVVYGLSSSDELSEGDRDGDGSLESGIGPGQSSSRKCTTVTKALGGAKWLDQSQS